MLLFFGQEQIPIEAKEVLASLSSTSYFPCPCFRFFTREPVSPAHKRNNRVDELIAESVSIIGCIEYRNYFCRRHVKTGMTQLIGHCSRQIGIGRVLLPGG